MKTYEVCLMPTSDFATKLQGDCLFGHICWQISHDPELVGKIDDILVDYDKNPFCVVSDPVARFDTNEGVEYIFPKAFCAIARKEINATDSFLARKNDYDKRKSAKSSKWTLVSKKKKLSLNNISDFGSLKELELDKTWKPSIEYRQSHNSIDRLTGTTGTSTAMAPFANDCIAWNHNTVLSVFIGIKENINKNGIKTAIERIGKFGYGADATTGKGRFSVLSMEEINLTELGDCNGNALYTLSSMVPEENIYKKVFFEPFVRFGRHGDALAISEYPFKAPVLKAAAGAVLIPFSADTLKQNYVGCAIKGLSKHESTVEQGYSLVIPMKVENGLC